MISSLRCWNQYQEHGRPTTWTLSFQRQNFFLPFSNDKTTKRKIFLAGLLWWPCIEISLISLLRKNWSEWSVNWEKSVIGDQWSDGRADGDGGEIGDQGGKRPHRHKSSHQWWCILILYDASWHVGFGDQWGVFHPARGHGHDRQACHGIFLLCGNQDRKTNLHPLSEMIYNNYKG